MRQRLFEASTRRADRGDSNDTRADHPPPRRAPRPESGPARLSRLRGVCARRSDGQDAGGRDRPADQLAPAADAKARGEAAKMQAIIDQAERRTSSWRRGTGSTTPSRCARPSTTWTKRKIKPYFELDRVLQDGVFFAANRLYGLTFKERKDLPVYHPDVRVFEVFDADGKSLALFYADYFKRDNKGGGAWMDSFVDQSGLLGTKPVVYNVATSPSRRRASRRC